MFKLSVSPTFFISVALQIMDYKEKARVLCKKIQEIRSLEDETNPETFKHDFPLALEFGLSNLTKIGMVALVETKESVYCEWKVWNKNNIHSICL